MTHVAGMNFKGITRKNLSDSMRAKLRTWTEGQLMPDPDEPADAPKGLWLFGPRRSGTSYVAKVVVGDLAYHHDLTDAVQVKALDLTDMVRGSWSMSSQVRSSMDDLGLWWELKNVEEMLDTYFNRLQVLWIDQLHHETIDMSMWKRHIQPRIEQRVDEQIVVVSTTMPPDDPAMPKGVIEDLFTCIFCDGYRPDAGR